MHIHFLVEMAGAVEQLLKQLLSQSIPQSLTTFTSISQLYQTHASLIVSGLSNHLITTSRLLACAAIPPYANLPYAYSIFRQIPNPNLFTFNTIIRGFSKNPHFSSSSVNFYIRMLRCGFVPDKFTFPFLIRSVVVTAGDFDLRIGRQLHAQIVRFGVECDLFVVNNLIGMYMAGNELCCAEQVFKECGLEAVDVVSWTAMVTGCADVGDVERARDYFDRMPCRNIVSWNAMVSGLARSGRVDEARKVFDKMPERDDASWSTMVSGYYQQGLYGEALGLFKKGFCEDGGAIVVPNEAALVSAVSSCAKIRSMEDGVWLHEFIEKGEFEIVFSSFVASSLLYLHFTSSSIDVFSTFNSYYYYTYNFTITTTTTTPPQPTTTETSFKTPPPPPHSIQQNHTYLHQHGESRNTTEIVPHRSKKPPEQDVPKEHPRTDVCEGRYIFMHEIPSKFNLGILQNCTNLLPMKDMCSYIRNDGLGPQISDKGLGFDSESWFNTDQFTLELIFHKRMKSFECLTRNSSLANAFFVPFYAGLDAGRFLWGSNTTVRDELSTELVEYVTKLKEWEVMDGRDHFLVAGRIGWDFQRFGNNETNWGTSLMSRIETKHITMLTIESTFYKNEVAIPYPTYFHPSKNEQIRKWQNKVESRKRRFLIAFAGAPRPDQSGSIRNELIRQCSAARKRCSLLNCINFLDAKCQQPQNVMKLFMKSKFCLQPSEDSWTRRSTFDAIISGCIPVFFKMESGPEQYIWHFTRNYSSYSVYIPEEDVQAKKADIRRILSHISSKKVEDMRRESIKMIPRVIYRNVGSGFGAGEMEKDAFDLAVDGILKRVENIKREFHSGNESGLYF